MTLTMQEWFSRHPKKVKRHRLGRLEFCPSLDFHVQLAAIMREQSPAVCSVACPPGPGYKWPTWLTVCTTHFPISLRGGSVNLSSLVERKLPEIYRFNGTTCLNHLQRRAKLCSSSKRHSCTWRSSSYSTVTCCCLKPCKFYYFCKFQPMRTKLFIREIYSLHKNLYTLLGSRLGNSGNQKELRVSLY